MKSSCLVGNCNAHKQAAKPGRIPHQGVCLKVAIAHTATRTLLEAGCPHGIWPKLSRPKFNSFGEISPLILRIDLFGAGVGVFNVGIRKFDSFG